MKKYIYKMKLEITIKILSGSISIACLAAIPYITKLLIDYDFSKSKNGIILFIAMYVLAVIGNLGFEYISQLYSWKLEVKFNKVIKKDFFDSILNYDYNRFIQSDVGAYISMLNNDVKVVEQYVEGIVSIIQYVIQLGIYGVYMFVLDPIIAAVIILCSSITIFLPNITSNKLSKRKEEHLNGLGMYIGKVKDLLEGYKNVNFETKFNISCEHNKTMTETENKLLRFGKFKTFTNVLNGSFMFFLSISAFATIAVLLMQSKITVGTATATLGYIESFVFPIRYILVDLSNVKSAKYTKKKLLEFMSVEENSQNKLKRFETAIEFSNISIKFDDFELCNFSYKFEKGKKYAIIGHSGSGKSTIVNLLMKYLTPIEGEILIDDVNINKIDTTGILGCVNQFEHVFSTDFLNNVTVFGTYTQSNLETS